MNAKGLLQRSVVIDTHLDLPCDLLDRRRRGRTHVLRDDHLEHFRAGGVNCIVSALYVDPDVDNCLQEAMLQIAALHEEIGECGGAVELVASMAQLERAVENGKIAVMLSIEGAECLVGHPELLRVYHSLGVRILGLCWSRSNWAADGCKFDDFDYVGYGLTDGGQRLLSLARELGMLIDVTHINEKGFWEVTGSSPQPVIATHSDTRAVSDTPRNLSDAQILEIGRLDGVIGINGCSKVASYRNVGQASVDTLVAHMLHIKQLIGSRHICIGLDLCERILEDQVPGEIKGGMFDVLKDHSRLDLLLEKMALAGFTEPEMAGVLGGNALRVMKQVIG